MERRKRIKEDWRLYDNNTSYNITNNRQSVEIKQGEQ